MKSFKSLFLTLFFTAFGIPIAATAGQIVDISALSETGTSITLAAGTYSVSVIGISQGGQYDGWDYATDNIGTASAAPAWNAWVDSFTMTIDGVSTSYLAAGNPSSTTASGALAVYQSSAFLANGSPTAGTNNITFTLTSQDTVNFTVADFLFWDNWGGESLSVAAVDPSAVPEPSALGMMGLAAAVVAGALRKKFSK